MPSDDIALRLRSHETEGVTSSDRYHLRNEAAAEIDSLREQLRKCGPNDAQDAARWRYARTIFSVEDVEQAVDQMRGFTATEEENAKADAAIDEARRCDATGDRQP